MATNEAFAIYINDLIAENEEKEAVLQQIIEHEQLLDIKSKIGLLDAALQLRLSTLTIKHIYEMNVDVDERLQNLIAKYTEAVKEIV